MSSIDPLRIGRFRSLWLASVVSNVGSFLQAVAAGWLMLELTRSPFWVGLMAATATLPLLFLALPAGALADMVDRRKLLLISQGLMGMSAMGMAALSFLDLITAPILLGLGLTLGVGLALNLPAWQAMVPDLVPRGLVASAVALNSVAFNVARAVGPALGGIIVATAGPDLAFFINGISFIGVVAVIASWRGARYGGDVPDSLGHSIALGVRFARFTPAFRRLLLVAAVFALTSAVVQSLLPNLTDESLNEDAHRRAPDPTRRYASIGDHDRGRVWRLRGHRTGHAERRVHRPGHRNRHNGAAPAVHQGAHHHRCRVEGRRRPMAHVRRR